MSFRIGFAVLSCVLVACGVGGEASSAGLGPGSRADDDAPRLTTPYVAWFLTEVAPYLDGGEEFPEEERARLVSAPERILTYVPSGDGTPVDTERSVAQLAYRTWFGGVISGVLLHRTLQVQRAEAALHSPSSPLRGDYAAYLHAVEVTPTQRAIIAFLEELRPIHPHPEMEALEFGSEWLTPIRVLLRHSALGVETARGSRDYLEKPWVMNDAEREFYDLIRRLGPRMHAEQPDGVYAAWLAEYQDVAVGIGWMRELHGPTLPTTNDPNHMLFLEMMRRDQPAAIGDADSTAWIDAIDDRRKFHTENDSAMELEKTAALVAARPAVLVGVRAYERWLFREPGVPVPFDAAWLAHRPCVPSDCERADALYAEYLRLTELTVEEAAGREPVSCNAASR